MKLHNNLNTDDKIFTSQKNTKAVLYIDLIISIIFLILLILFFDLYLLIISFWIGAIIGSMALLRLGSIKVILIKNEIEIVRKILFSKIKIEEHIQFNEIEKITLSTQLSDTSLFYPTLIITTKNGKHHYLTSGFGELKIEDIFIIAKFLEKKTEQFGYDFKNGIPSSLGYIRNIQQKFWTEEEIMQTNYWRKKSSSPTNNIIKMQNKFN
jgi:hypothetical protein